MPEGERIKICEWIETAIADSDRIISSLVDYASDLHLKMEHCTPKSLTHRALSKVTIPERINVINLSTDEIDMYLDAQKIETSFIRIIQNAIDAMPENGSLKISSASKEFICRNIFSRFWNRHIRRQSYPSFLLHSLRQKQKEWA